MFFSIIDHAGMGRDGMLMGWMYGRRGGVSGMACTTWQNKTSPTSEDIGDNLLNFILNDLP